MKTVLLIIALVIVPVLLASRENREDGGEGLREKRVHIVRNDEKGRFSIENLRTDNKSEDDEDDDDEEEDDGNEASNNDEQNGRDSVQASGDDDDKNENSVNNDDDDDDDDDEGKNQAQKVVCKRRCAPPMTFDQCANPRCAMKHNIVKELCYYLCKHQQVKCRETCEPE